MSNRIVIESISSWNFNSEFIFESFVNNLFNKKIILSEDISNAAESISGKLKDSIESKNLSKVKSVMKKIPKVDESKLVKIGNKLDSNFNTYMKESEKQLKTTKMHPKLQRSVSFALSAGAIVENKKRKRLENIYN